MYAACLQDWVTIQSGSTNPVTQGEGSWIDTSGFLDCVIFMETKTVSGNGIFMAFQTSPTKDDRLFFAMNDIVNGPAVTTGLQVFVLLRDQALCPLCHWLRWQIGTTGASAYNATFRIWAALNQPGGVATLSKEDPSAVNMEFEGSPAWTLGASGGSAQQAPSRTVGLGLGTSLLPQPVKPSKTYTGMGMEVGPVRGSPTVQRSTRSLLRPPSKSAPQPGVVSLNNARSQVLWVPPEKKQ